MTDVPSSFHRLLKYHRLAAELTQEDLAERAQLSARAISDLERGIKTVPHRDTVESLARALGLPVEELERVVPRRRGPRASRTLAQLPVTPTSFIGRDAEVCDVVTLLRSPETRLVTVTGPPGIGKTRLTLASAEKASTEFPDGVVFVPLAALRDTALVVPSLAQALGIQRSRFSSLEQHVVDYLQSRRLLLIIDNFEHVLDAGNVIARILAACSDVKFLISSRAALNVRREHRFELGPLAVPPSGVALAVDDLSRYPALLLFSERARMVSPGFQLTPNNLGAVAGICRRLNGLPLAIELASARANMLSPSALLQRLGDQLRVLTGGSRDVPERHRTMRSAIAWSYDLLNERERRLFRQLAYFAGGFSIEAVESIAGSDDRPFGNVLDELTSLVDKSLVLTTPGEADETRFAMLETIRAFGMECLEESGELAPTSARHCEYYVDLVERSYREQVGNKQSLWFRRLEYEQGNLRVAARWIVENDDGDRARRFGHSLWRFWDRGHILEGQRWLNAFLGMPEMALPNPGRCPLLFAAGRLAYRQAEYASATTLLQECLAIARAENDDNFTSAALTQLGHVAYAQGNLPSAERHYTESLTIRRTTGDARTIGISLRSLALVQRARGVYAGAGVLLHECLAHSRETQNTVEISIALAGLGFVALLEDAYAEADEFYRESLDRSLDVNDQHEVATALIGLARVAIERGLPQRAAELLRQSLAIARTVGGRQLLAMSLEGFAMVLAATGQARRSWQLVASVAAYRERVGLSQDPGDKILLDRFFDATSATLDSHERAANLLSDRLLTIEQAISAVEQLDIGTPARSNGCEPVALHDD
jgi:non-specific serine/threonine protein kinase